MALPESESEPGKKDVDYLLPAATSRGSEK